MTRFFINEREIAPPMTLSSLDQILKHVEEHHLPPSSAIRQICVDGLSLMPGVLEGKAGEVIQQLEDREKVEIFTGTLWEIAHDSITETIAYLDRIEAITPSLATSFQTSPGPQSHESLRQLCEGFYWLILLLDKLRMSFRLDLDDLLIQGIPVSEHHRNFISILKQLVDSQEKGDFVLIADLIEYEILRLVPVWRELFEDILKKIC